MAKKFQINNKKPKWLKQQDNHSCGYYLIHNTQPYLLDSKYEGSPDGIFKKINELKKSKGEKPLARSANVPSTDLSDYLHDKGFKVNPFSNPNHSLATIEEILAKKEFDLIYLTSNNHYTGIVKNQTNLMYLDSLTDKPSIISINETREKIKASLGQETNGRYNLVGIVTKSPKKFQIDN